MILDPRKRTGTQESKQLINGTILSTICRLDNVRKKQVFGKNNYTEQTSLEIK